MTRSNDIIAIGLLTAFDLERLGAGFTRAFPVAPDDSFEDLIAKLDSVEWRNRADEVEE